jgi:pimeloyl-ACP methyl ester carboxylesterase
MRLNRIGTRLVQAALGIGLIGGWTARRTPRSGSSVTEPSTCRVYEKKSGLPSAKMPEPIECWKRRVEESCLIRAREDLPMEPIAVKRRIRRAAAWIVGVAVFLFASVYAGISTFTADRLTRPTNRPLPIDARQVSEDAQAWSTRTSDGLTLRGWYLPTEKKRHLVVLVHGMWSSWLEMAGLGRDLHDQGFDVLLFDLRGHGQSDPSRLYLGRRERGDIRAVMAWALSQGFSNDRIGWLGYSMGGSTLLMEAARNPEIQVAVIDSPYGDLPRLLDTQLSKHSGLPRWFNPGILLAARWVYGVRTDDLIPLRSARSWGERPLLLIHGESDTTVPVSQARELAKTLGTSCLTLTIPGVEHVQAYETDPQGYVQMVGSFFDSHLSP